MGKYGVLLFQLLIVFTLLLSGCFKGEQALNEIDVPQEYTGEEKEELVDEQEEPEEDEQTIVVNETIDRQLFLIDESGMVVPQTLKLPTIESKAVATQVLNYLIKEGPVTEILPNGFQAVIPAGTEIIGLNLLEDGTLIVDVSEDFKMYEAEDELKIIQAMTFTLTQFENVDRIKLWINGVSQSTMPVNGTPISEGYSKSNGINVYLDEQPNLQYSKVVTIFYPKQHNDNQYFVPVTQYINNQDDQLYGLMVQALLEGPAIDIQSTHVFNDETSLVNQPKVIDGVLQLIFNEDILKDKAEAIIADEVVETIVRTFSNQTEIQAVEVKVENNTSVKNESGTIYDKPVSVYSGAAMEI